MKKVTVSNRLTKGKDNNQGNKVMVNRSSRVPCKQDDWESMSTKGECTQVRTDQKR